MNVFGYGTDATRLFVLGGRHFAQQKRKPSKAHVRWRDVQDFGNTNAGLWVANHRRAMASSSFAAVINSCRHG